MTWIQRLNFGRLGMGCVAAAITFCLSVSAFGASPESLRLQGRLETASGTAVTSSAVTVKVSLYATKTAGTAIYVEVFNNVALDKGRFAFDLGQSPTLGKLATVVAANPEVWMGVSINGGAELTRQQLMSVPFALQANDVQCDGCIDASDLAAGAGGSGKWADVAGGGIHYNDGNVGVGTSTPENFRLVVSGDGGAAGHVGMFASGSTVAYVGIASAKTSHYLYSHDDGRFGVHVPGVGDKLTILDNGNVGIGTNAPKERLDVSSTGNTTIRAASSAGKQARFMLSAGGAVEGWSILSGYPDADNFAIHQHGIGNHLTVKNGGNVGIGTTSPSEKLEVAGTVKATKFEGDGSSLTGVSAGKWSDATGGTGIEYSAGKVGIGTTSPVEELDVVGDVGVSNNLIVQNGTLTNYIRTNDGNVGAPGYEFQADTDTGFYRPAANAIGFVTGGAERMRIDPSGKVGIGTTTPGASLAVRGATSANDRVQRWGQGGASGDHSTLELYKTADKSGDWLFRAYWAGSGNSGKLGFGKYAASPWDGAQMVLDTNTGNVGIGTNAPTSKLQVVGGDFVVDNAGYVTQIGHPNGNSYIGGNLIHFRAGAAGSYATKMLIDTPSGNVGIGTTSPSEKLHVKGAIRAGNRIDIYEGTDTTRVGLLGAWNDLGGGSLPSGNDFVVKAGSGLGISFAPNNGGSAVYIAPSGNMGVGTTSPQAKLDVAGGIKAGNDTASCDANKAGTIRFGSSSALETCVESAGTHAWTKLAGGKASVSLVWHDSDVTDWDGKVLQYIFFPGVVDKKGGEKSPYEDGIFTKSTFTGNWRYLVTVTSQASNHKHTTFFVYNSSLDGTVKQGCNPAQTDQPGGLCVYSHQTALSIHLEGSQVYSQGTVSPAYSVEINRTDGKYEVLINGASVWTGTPSYTGSVRFGRSAANGAESFTKNVGWWVESSVLLGGVTVGHDTSDCSSAKGGTLRYTPDGVLEVCVKEGGAFSWTKLAGSGGSGGTSTLAWKASQKSYWVGKTDKYAFSTGVVDKYGGESPPYEDGIYTVPSFTGDFRYKTTVTSQSTANTNLYLTVYNASLAGSVKQGCGAPTNELGGLCVYSYKTGYQVWQEGILHFSGPKLTPPFTLEARRTGIKYEVFVNDALVWNGAPSYTGTVRFGRSAANGAQASTQDVGWWIEE